MTAYFLRRLLLMIPTLLGITMMVFCITRFVPGGPIDQKIQELQQGGAGGEAGSSGGFNHGGDANIPPAVMEELNKRYGFDRPWPVAYVHWLGDVVRGDLGDSYKYSQPVVSVISSRFPVSIYFGLIGFALAYLVCIPLGVIKAIKHSGTFDLLSSSLVFAGYSIPGWALGTLMLVYLGGGSFWSLFPLGGFRSPVFDERWAAGDYWWCVRDQLHHTILPIISYMVGSFASLTILTKNALMENLGQDYVRTAFAKGLTERRVVFVHALRNSLIPLCTGLGHAIGLLMAGSYLIEFVFNIDGIGYLGYTSIVGRDYTVVMGILVINTALVLLGNVLSDVLYVGVDPRIRFD